jgi:hypothetical protein
MKFWGIPEVNLTRRTEPGLCDTLQAAALASRGLLLEVIEQRKRKPVLHGCVGDEKQEPRTAVTATTSSRGLSRGVEDAEATGGLRIAGHHLDWGPGPLPDVDLRRAGELNLPAGALDHDAGPSSGDARAVRAVDSE